MDRPRFDADARPVEVPIPTDPALRGKWVAIQGNTVVLVASSHQELVRKVRSKGLKGGTFVARHVATPPNEVVVGVG